ncbi:hypothetical protein GCM10018980_51480 [Streptomyces capoamus]|uniref:YspA cpYpsA-related SLOG domain-containing protein n=1 Tax=Streptomyces capoamus TaxID=68183 RepID=A0A919EZ20_9ACTN|nr:DUF2493 domain-containing protein [Streptomyces capoamus]GGW15803.1 hypothetical protein GCM10010501_29330 [Streptomyces libani subsp. rufus]GHG61939.1 hypothetical protein GCM10018980_51480 [Streptomyces capoamus]
MTAPYRILVTGSRTWTDVGAIQKALAKAVEAIPADRQIIVVHGACPNGADAIADQWARQYGATVERHPANWRPNGVLDRAAGYRRNAEMVLSGADLCLAFIRNISPGATHCAATAERAGIPVRRFTA